MRAGSFFARAGGLPLATAGLNGSENASCSRSSFAAAATPTVSGADQHMATRDMVIQLTDGLSEAQLEAVYQHLLQVSKPGPSDAEVAEALDHLANLAKRLDVKTDAVQLIRDERGWHANRWP